MSAAVRERVEFSSAKCLSVRPERSGASPILGHAHREWQLISSLAYSLWRSQSTTQLNAALHSLSQLTEPRLPLRLPSRFPSPVPERHLPPPSCPSQPPSSFGQATARDRQHTLC